MSDIIQQQIRTEKKEEKKILVVWVTEPCTANIIQQQIGTEEKKKKFW